MTMAETKKYYWLRLKRDFFKRHDTRIIESMENGEKYILFYLKLLVESIDHEGSLRFSDTIPYNEKMLATITNTDVDIVRSAVKLFTELEMMDRLDDGTLYMAHVNTMIGSETEWADKQRIYRERKQLEPRVNKDTDDTMSGQKKTMSDKRLETEYRERDKEKEEDTTAPIVAEVPEPSAVISPKTSKAVAVKPQASPLYHAISQCFLSKTPTFANYAKEALATKRIEAFAGRYEPENREGATLALIEKYWQLVQSLDTIWHKQPFTPSGLSSMMDRVARELEIDRPQTQEEYEQAYRDAEGVPF